MLDRQRPLIPQLICRPPAPTMIMQKSSHCSRCPLVFERALELRGRRRNSPPQGVDIHDVVGVDLNSDDLRAREGRGGADRRALGSLRLAPFYLRFVLWFRWWGEGWRSGVGSCRCGGAGCCGRVGSRATGSDSRPPSSQLDGISAGVDRQGRPKDCSTSSSKPILEGPWCRFRREARARERHCSGG